MQQEKRQHPRHPLTPGHFRVPGDRRYTLKDISMGGLSFLYPAEDELPLEAPAIAKRLFMPDELSLDTIRCITISDAPVATEESGTTPLRRRGVKFDKPNSMQRLMLRYFIWLQPATPLNQDGNS